MHRPALPMISATRALAVALCLLWVRAAQANGPVIRHTPPSSLVSREDVILTATCECTGGFAEAVVYARPQGERDFRKFPMKQTGQAFQVAIPAAFAAKAGALEYYIVAYDAASLEELLWSSKSQPYRLKPRPAHETRESQAPREAREKREQREEGAPSAHKLSVTAQPDNAIIDLDGATVGTGTCSTPVLPGPHRITVHLTGYQTMNLDIRMPAGRDLQLTPKLSPAVAAETAPASPPPAAQPSPQVSGGEQGASHPAPPDASAASGAEKESTEKVIWIRIPHRTFAMGSDPSQEEARSDERPVTRVSLKAFEIHRTEVSVAQYKACVDAGGCTPPSTRPEWPGASAAEKRQWSAFCNWGKPDKANHPVNCVDWKQARAYCQWQGGRLPTEAEWELAARGTDGRTYPWGNSDPDDAKARFGHLTGGTVPVETGSAGASAFGLLQMAGNVWEWVADAYGPYPGGSATDPFRDDGSQRVVRGGGWASDKPVKLRATIRDSNDPSSRLSDVGFRCARTPSHL